MRHNPTSGLGGKRRQREVALLGPLRLKLQRTCRQSRPTLLPISNSWVVGCLCSCYSPQATLIANQFPPSALGRQTEAARSFFHWLVIGSASCTRPKPRALATSFVLMRHNPTSGLGGKRRQREVALLGPLRLKLQRTFKQSRPTLLPISNSWVVGCLCSCYSLQT